MESFEKTNINTVKRIPKRGHYDKETVYKILDENFLCHVSFSVEGQPFIIPTAFGRMGDNIYFHGATTSRMLQQLEKGLPVAVAVTTVDALVLARSAFHHSMNYHSVVLFGKANIAQNEEKLAGLKAISEQILKGRWQECRPPSEKELKATTVLSLKIESASAKIRDEGVNDAEEDLSLPYWAGLLPIVSSFGNPLADENCKEPLPASVERLG